MIRSKLLDYAHRGTRHRAFAPFHELVRQVYLGPFIQVFSRAMAAGAGVRELKIQARNSAASGIGFNAFSSDLDCVALIPPGTDGDPRLARLLRIYKRTRRVLPFLGELELYTPSEWRTKLELSSRGERLFKVILEIRRIVWQEEAFVKARSSYHRTKALFAIQKRLDEIDPSGGHRAGPTGNLAKIGPALEAEFVRLSGAPIALSETNSRVSGFYRFSKFLGCYVGTLPQGNRREIILSRPVTERLLSILPDGEVMAPDLMIAINELRSEPLYRAIWRSVATHEMLLVRSIVRQGRGDEMTAHWLRQLESELRR